jgi:hypothetical protein
MLLERINEGGRQGEIEHSLRKEIFTEVTKERDYWEDLSFVFTGVKSMY